MSRSIPSRQRRGTALMALALAALLAPLAAAQTGSAPAKASPAKASPPASAPAKNPSPEQLFTSWDTDKNKNLSVAEFTAGWEQLRSASIMNRLQMQFRASDTNGNGTLEASEYAALPIIRNSGNTAPPMATFDANKNQSLDFKEFLAFVEAAGKNARPNPPKP